MESYDKSSDVYLSSGRKFSAGEWPIIRKEFLWTFADEESELSYTEAIFHYADKLMADRDVMQAELETWVPSTGAYVNSKARYLKLCHKPKNNDGIFSIRFNYNNSRLIIGYESGCIEAIDLVNELCIPVKDADKSSRAPTSIKYHPYNSNMFYFSCTSGSIFSCLKANSDMDLEQYGTNKIISEGKNEIYAMDINTTGEKMITGGKDSRIRIYDLETYDVTSCYRGFAMECKDSYTRLLEEDEEEGHYLNIYSIVCHPEHSNIFASGGLDSNIKIWDLRVKQFPIKTIHGPHIFGDSVDLLGNKVLSGQWSSTEGLQVWDIGSCRLLNTFKPTNKCPQSFGQYFYCAKFMKGLSDSMSGDVVLAGGAGMGGLIVVSISENMILAQFKDSGTVLTVDNHTEWVAHGGTSHILYISQFFANTTSQLQCSIDAYDESLQSLAA